MAASTKDVLAQAMTLTPNERASLLQELAESLDRPDAELDRLWIAEARRRMDAYRRGEIEAVDAEVVLGELDDKA